MAGSQWKAQKKTLLGGNSLGFGEGLRAGDQRTQTGRGKIQDGLERKGKSKEPRNIHITVIKMMGLYEIMCVTLLKIL